jgi:hypothetical protein
MEIKHMEQTESTQLDGTQDANSAASSGAVSQNSFDPDKFARDLEARILARINDPKQVQSLKDRTIAEIKKDKGLREVYADVRAMQAEGLSDKEIEREIRIRELEARIAGTSEPSTQSPGKAVERAANDPVMSVISAYKLDENDPEVTSIMLGNDPVEKIAQLAILAQRKQQSHSPSIVAQPAGGNRPSPNMAQLESQYKKEVMSARGNKTAVQEVQEKYKQQGLDIYSVVLTV